MKAATTPRLHRANRTAARISLYSSLVLTTVFAAVFVVGSRSFDTGGADLGWTPREFERIEEVVLLQDYLRIDTTAETGSEMAGARYLAEVLARDGIESEIIDMGGRRANLIAVLPGDSDQALVLHNHIDVDPIRDPEKWVLPAVQRHHQAALDLWPRRLRHEERRHRAAARAGRAQAQRRAPPPLGRLPRHQRRGDRELDRHGVAPARANRPSG